MRRAKRRGLSLAEAQATIRLEDFRHLGRYDDWLGENIAGVYRILEERGSTAD